MSSTRLVLDIATCALDGAEAWLPAVKPRGNLKDPAKVEADLADKRAAQIEGLALDLDLCRVSALGVCDVSGWGASPIRVEVAATEADEAILLEHWHSRLREAHLVTFNGLAFDLPVLARRMLYLKLPALGWNLDRYRSPHVDLLAKLSDHGARPYRSLEFYARRLGWTDLVKPLSGADEALAPGRGQWVELAESVRHDVAATCRLARWMGILGSEVDLEVPA